MSESTAIEKNPKKGKRGIENKKRNTIIGVVITIFVLGIIINIFNKTQIYNDVIAKNIFVEDVDVSKMTKEEALKLVSSNYTPKSMYFSYEGKKYEIKPKEIDLKYNVEETVDKAYNYTKTDDYFENISRYFSLKGSKKEMKINAYYNEAKLSEEIQKISTDINQEVKDAKLYISGYGEMNVSESVKGKELDIAKTQETILNNLKNKKYPEVNLVVNVKEPNVHTDDVKSVNALLGEYTTKFSTGISGRVANIRLSAKKASDILLMPGEEYSYNNLIGPVNKANGYKGAQVIVNGKLQEGTGGGVCQVSTTLYNAVLYSGSQLTSITNHSLLSTYVPIGRDAMVNDGGSDFRFKNPYSHPIYIKNLVGNGSVTSRIYGNAGDKQRIQIKVDAFRQNGLNASNTYRIYKDSNGKTIKTEFIDKSVYKNPKR